MNDACASCPRKYAALPGDGPQPASLLIVGERPGLNENRYGRVFIGKTGEELNETYLPLANLRRSDVRITNAVRCWADNNRTPTDKEILACSRHHLPSELAATKPDVVMLMGGSACRMVPSIRLDTHHGIPQWGKLFDYEGWIIPMYHPALGLHESKWMTYLLEDWSQWAGRMVKEHYSPGVKKAAPTDYRIADRAELASYLNSLSAVLDISVDTEDHGGVPWSVQVSHRPGSARLIRANDRDSLGYLAEWARASSTDWTFHNAPGDLDVLAQMGVQVSRYEDTMQQAYHLSNLPQGLKPLVYRLFGFTMTSWEDVVRPYSIDALIYWMVEALEISRADLSLVEVKRLKTKIRETVKKGPLEQLLSRLLQHTSRESDYDPWDRLGQFWTDDANDHAISHIEARIGSYPILGIANAPLSKAVTYACGDADWTGRVAVELAKRRQDPYWQIAEEDKDQ